MTKNLGNRDRALRVLAALLMVTCAFMAPLPPFTRLALFGGMGAYLLLTALAGTCFGYMLMGKSTCPIERPT